MKLSDKDRKGVILFIILSVILLAGGILLLIAGQDGEVWKSVVGGILTFFGGIFLLSMVTALIASGQKKPASMPRQTDPLGALTKGQITQARYDAIRKKEIVALVVMIALAVAMLAVWFNLFSLLLAVSMTAGAAGALVLLQKGKSGLWALTLVISLIAGLVLALSSGTPATGKRYTYFVNGIKVGEGDGSVSNFLGGILGGAVLCMALIMGIAYGITLLCSGLTRIRP